MLWLILLILLIILLVGSTPVWPYSRGWGYNPVGLLAFLAVVVIILWLLGVISINAFILAPTF
ncbi:MAG TPA: DUF3309 family protein [Thermomicrobiaceae bacterium]|nr:DUF3309 family protein [Thermomicrobiaceae bacterium]